MSRYTELRGRPVDPTKADLKKDLKVVLLEMVSVMCDNVGYLKITNEGDEKVTIKHYNDHVALAFSNLQAEANAQEMIRWAMLDNNLKEIIRLANSGTSVIGSIKIREQKKESA